MVNGYPLTATGAINRHPDRRVLKSSCCSATIVSITLSLPYPLAYPLAATAYQDNPSFFVGSRSREPPAHAGRDHPTWRRVVFTGRSVGQSMTSRSGGQSEFDRPFCCFFFQASRESGG